MSNLQAFFAQNVRSDIVEEFVVSERFKGEDGKPIPWKLRALTEEENEQIRRASMRPTEKKREPGQIQPDVYLAKVVVASVVFPDLKNAELQQSYGVMGAEALLKRMLLSGEYARLAKKVQEINGFDKDFNDLIDEAKN